MTAQEYITAYQMLPHPEGGFYAETYRAAEIIPHAALPARFSGSRTFGTAIYFLLENHHRSTLHRIQSDEVWHFYAGGPLNVYVIEPQSGTVQIIRLGNRPDRGEVFQAVVPAGSWFGSKPVGEADVPAFSLMGCTVAPGFDFADFELADPAQMLATYPQHREIVELLQ
jgi:uncharacterized protein